MHLIEHLRAEVFGQRRHLVHLRHEPDERLERPAADLLAGGDVDEELPEES